MKFNRIGYAREYLSEKSGKKSLRLLIDPAALRQMTDKDIKNGIFMFRHIVDGKDKGYVVNAPTPEDYKLDHEKLFEKPQHGQNPGTVQTKPQEERSVDMAGQDIPF